MSIQKILSNGKREKELDPELVQEVGSQWQVGCGGSAAEDDSQASGSQTGR